MKRCLGSDNVLLAAEYREKLVRHEMYAVALELFQFTVTAFQDFRMIYVQI